MKHQLPLLTCRLYLVPPFQRGPRGKGETQQTRPQSGDSGQQQQQSAMLTGRALDAV